MTSDDDLIAELWREVRPNQLALVKQLVADVNRVWAELARGDLPDPEAWRRIRTAAHRLAGTLGSFGQQPAGELAVALDRVVSAIDRPDEGLMARVAGLVQALHQELARDPGAEPGT